MILTFEPYEPRMFPLFLFYIGLAIFSSIFTIKIFLKYRERKTKPTLHLTLVFVCLTGAVISLIFGLAETIIMGYKMYIYITIGFLCAVAAILSMGRVMHIYPTIGTGYELQAIAAVVVGGTSIWGGSGSVIRTFLGAVLMGVILVGLTMMGVHPYWQESVTGLLIIFAISIDSLRHHKRFKG